MKYPPLEHKLRTYRFERLRDGFLGKYLAAIYLAVAGILLLLWVLFSSAWPFAVFVTLGAAMCSLGACIADYCGEKRALSEIQRELPRGETYEPPKGLF
ncbi:MAG: hypothetical protein ACNA7T_15870 [Haliea sp.]